MKQQSKERSFKDPVCGMEVSRMTAIDECVYRGKTYYFCDRTCREAFEAEPVSGAADIASKLEALGASLRWAGGAFDEVKINNVPAGKVTTVNGGFSIKYNVPANKTGAVPVEARFAGDTLYVPNVANASVPIKAPPVKVYLFWNNAEGRVGDTITLTGCLGRSATTPCAQPVAGQKVRFWADRGPRWNPSIQVPSFQLGSGMTNAQGKVTASWKVELGNVSLSNKDLPQSYTLSAHADVDYNQYSQEKKSDPHLKVNRTPSALAITAPGNAKIGQTFTLKVRLTRTPDNAPIKAVKVTGPFGQQTTNDNGEASASYTVPSQMGTGSKPLLFKFAGEHRYLPVEKSQNIQISPSTN